jgi:uncharacterized protein YggE
MRPQGRAVQNPRGRAKNLAQRLDEAVDKVVEIRVRRLQLVDHPD